VAAAASLLSGILQPKLLQQYSSVVMNAQNDPIALNKLMQSYLEHPNTTDFNNNQQDLFNTNKQESNLNRLNIIETDELEDPQESAVNISFNQNEAMHISKPADDSVLFDLNTELNDTTIGNVNNLSNNLNETSQDNLNQLNTNLNDELDTKVANDPFKNSDLINTTAVSQQKLKNDQDETNDDDQQIDNIVINFQENEEEDEDTEIKLDTNN
jgi:hypothetical protein